MIAEKATVEVVQGDRSIFGFETLFDLADMPGTTAMDGIEIADGVDRHGRLFDQSSQQQADGGFDKLYGQSRPLFYGFGKNLIAGQLLFEPVGDLLIEGGEVEVALSGAK